jgi:hypothetical protein
MTDGWTAEEDGQVEELRGQDTILEQNVELSCK